MEPAKKSNKSQRTIQVKIGNNKAKSLTPDEAADYLKTIASQGWMSNSSNLSTNGREVHMTFAGPSSGTAASAVLKASTAAAAAAGGTSSTASTTSTTTTTTTTTANAITSSKNKKSRREPGMPCSEKEMKALMSMFVEIMGLQMNTERLNHSKLFSFPTNVPPPPGGWPDDLLWPTDTAATVPPLSGCTLQDRDELDGLPELEVIPKEERKVAAQFRWPVVVIDDDEDEDKDEQHYVTGLSGIVPFEWEALERVAVEEALEHEERCRKGSKKTPPTESSKKKAELVNEAALQKAEELHQARKKTILTWRARVVSVFSKESSRPECPKLQELLKDSPLEYEKLDSVQLHLSVFLPLLLPKHRGACASSKTLQQKARTLLADYCCQLHVPLLTQPLPRNGRSVLHMAAWYGDARLVRKICLESVQQLGSSSSNTNNNSGGGGKKKKKKKSTTPPPPQLEATCHESGWTPLHYAAVSGSLLALEALLQVGCRVTVRTNDTHTWSQSTGRGLEASELVQWIRSGKHETAIETVGMALQQVQKECLGGTKDERDRYLALLEKVADRLHSVETRGYTSRSVEEVEKEIHAVDVSLQKQKKEKAVAAAAAETTASSKRNRKKKKNKASSTNASTTSSDPESSKVTATATAAPSLPTRQEDPLVTALLGMGFTNEQIQSGIKACGGHNRATADDVVAWIFGQQDGGSSPVPEAEAAVATTTAARPVEEETWNAVATAEPAKKREDSVDSRAKRLEEEERLKESERQAKREEQRRRNREWNNRARQRQEAKLAKEARPPPVARPPTEALPPPQPSRVSSTSSKTRKPVEPVWTTSANNNSNEAASTAASSFEHGTIEIIQDDATISTIGSFRTVPSLAVPPPPPPALAPPGFAAAEPQEATMPWEVPQHQQQQQQHQFLPHDYHRSSSHGSAVDVGLPPGIPESTPLPTQIASGSLHAPPMHHQHSFPLETNNTGFGGGPSLLGGTPLVGGNGLGSLFSTPESYNNRNTNHAPVHELQHSNSVPIMGSSTETPSSLAPTGPPPIPGFLDTTTAAAAAPPPPPSALEASIIDSLSTGLGGTALWGTGGTGPVRESSAMLGSVIPTADTTTGAHYTTTSSNSTNMFGSRTEELRHGASWDEQQQQQRREQQQQQPTRRTWEGGQAPGTSIW